MKFKFPGVILGVGLTLVLIQCTPVSLTQTPPAVDYLSFTVGTSDLGDNQLLLRRKLSNHLL